MAYDGTKPAYQGPLNSQPIRDNFAALKSQIDAEHNADGTHKDVLKGTGGTATGDIMIKKNTPALRLKGTEGSAVDIRMVESAGDFYIQRNTGTEATPVWSTVFKLKMSNLLIEGAKINETNFLAGTSIPDTYLSTIATAGKVSSSALPSNVAYRDSANEFTQTQTVKGSNTFLKLDHTGDSTYYTALIKMSTTGGYQIQLRKKSDNSVHKYWNFDANGKFLAETVEASGQLVSTVAAGTPPLAVVSPTKVPNLHVERASVADVANGVAVTNLSAGSTVVFATRDKYGYTTTYTAPEQKVVDLLVPWGGVIRFEYYFRATRENQFTNPWYDVPEVGTTRITKNGLQVGSFNSVATGDGWTLITADITVSIGDVLSIYTRQNTTNYSVPKRVGVEKVTIKAAQALTPIISYNDPLSPLQQYSPPEGGG